MNDNIANTASAGPLLPWPECDVFCIHDYAGASASPCGWRGKFTEARHDATGLKRLCPRCGCATLLRLPRIAGFNG